MKTSITSWKTTLMGAALAGMWAIKTMVLTGQVSWPDLAICFGFAFFGALAKDGNVTGGTIPVTTEAAGRVQTSDGKPTMFGAIMFALKNRKAIENLIAPAAKAEIVKSVEPGKL